MELRSNGEGTGVPLTANRPQNTLTRRVTIKAILTKRPYWSVFVVVQLAGCLSFLLVRNDFRKRGGHAATVAGIIYWSRCCRNCGYGCRWLGCFTGLAMVRGDTDYLARYQFRNFVCSDYPS